MKRYQCDYVFEMNPIYPNIEVMCNFMVANGVMGCKSPFYYGTQYGDNAQKSVHYRRPIFTAKKDVS